LFLENLLDQVQQLSDFVFSECNDLWNNQKELYKICREKFPSINSKILQNFISIYKPIRKKSKPKHKAIKSSIYLDYQNQNVKITNNKLTGFWLRFSRWNFPLFGKYLETKLQDTSKIKLVQIYKKNNKLYCKLVYVEEREDIISFVSSKTLGLDINYKRAVLSDNSFYQIKRLAHRKLEHKKHKQTKRNLTNYSRDFMHKLTTQISEDLYQKGVEVLVLEDLRSLKKSASRKFGTNRGKLLNYIINSFPYSVFQTFLSYKCLDLGIKVEKINPAYTSKTCSRCNSKNTLRPKQDKFICQDCNLKLDADLNGSRNIEIFYMNSQWATNESSPG
jgi:IS605 OrfB family transposase